VTNTGVKVMDKKTKKIKTIDASLVVWATGVGPIALTQTIRASIGQEAQVTTSFLNFCCCYPLLS
jgi:NADH dehydrogenase FAD-containing subunit